MPLPSVRPLKLLLAEDSLANQKLAVGLLTRWGHTLHVVDNGHLAVTAVQEGHFDAVLMDVQMPELDGIQATRQIREWEGPLGRRIPIVAMTAHAMKGDRERCLAAGMDGYISKPLRPHDVAEVLAALFPAAAAERDGSGPSAAVADAAQRARATAINWQSALAATQGDPFLLREVADVCAAEMPRLRAELEAALGRQQSAEVLRLAHTIKGNLRTFGARGVESAEQLEQTAKSGDLTGAEPLLQALQADLSLVEQALADFLATSPAVSRDV
jgi:two-component system, sensor histidine kinase and response regulator